MKKIILILIVAVCPILSQAQLKKVALISVFGSRNLSDNPLETKIYEAIMKDSSFNLEKIVTSFDSLIIASFLPQFPFPFLPKQEVINAKGYPELKALTTWAKDDWYTTPAAGYVPIAAYGIVDDDKAIQKAFELLPEIDGVMVAYIDFNLYDAMGIGGLTSKKVYAYVNIKIFDKSGKLVFKLKERASSSQGVMAAYGYVTDVKKLMPMVKDASEKLFVDMQLKLPKSLAKMAKKMAN